MRVESGFRGYRVVVRVTIRVVIIHHELYTYCKVMRFNHIVMGENPALRGTLDEDSAGVKRVSTDANHSQGQLAPAITRPARRFPGTTHTL